MSTPPPGDGDRPERRTHGRLTAEEQRRFDEIVAGMRVEPPPIRLFAVAASLIVAVWTLLLTTVLQVGLPAASIIVGLTPLVPLTVRHLTRRLNRRR